MQHENPWWTRSTTTTRWSNEWFNGRGEEIPYES
jgi:hypothetical protein